MGPAVKNWYDYKVISLKAKIIATVLIILAMAYVGIYSVVAIYVKAIMLTVCSSVLTYIWLQKSNIRRGVNMEFRARHILVENKHEAEDIIRHLNDGKEFSELASKFSKCPSGQMGGDLGNFRLGQMVAPFEEAVKGLEVGQVSQPVQTQFGYHIIERLDVN